MELEEANDDVMGPAAKEVGRDSTNSEDDCEEEDKEQDSDEEDEIEIDISVD